MRPVAVEREIATSRTFMCIKHDEKYVRKPPQWYSNRKYIEVFVCKSCVAEAKASVARALMCFAHSGHSGAHGGTAWPNKLGVTW